MPPFYTEALRRLPTPLRRFGSSMDITDQLFISAGMDYYVAGRYAVFARLNPTAANLLHHAVEMVLKGALAKKGMDLKALKGPPSRWPVSRRESERRVKASEVARPAPQTESVLGVIRGR